MRNDQFPDATAESAGGPDPRNPSTVGVPLMAVAPLGTLQQRLDALEEFYVVGNRNDESSMYRPRIARIAPNIVVAPANALPPIEYQFGLFSMPGNHTVNLSSLHLANPTAAAFSSAAAATTAVDFSSAASAAGTVAAPPRVAAIFSTGRDTSHSAAYTSVSTNTATYSPAPVRDATNTCLYCVASTSYALPVFNYSPPANTNSDTDSATSPETVIANELSSVSEMLSRPVPGAFRRRVFDEYDDDGMAEQSVPRKVAKRSEQHLMVNNGDRNDRGGVGDDRGGVGDDRGGVGDDRGGVGDDRGGAGDDDMMMDCSASE